MADFDISARNPVSGPNNAGGALSGNVSENVLFRHISAKSLALSKGSGKISKTLNLVKSMILCDFRVRKVPKIDIFCQNRLKTTGFSAGKQWFSPFQSRLSWRPVSVGESSLLKIDTSSDAPG